MGTTRIPDFFLNIHLYLLIDKKMKRIFLIVISILPVFFISGKKCCEKESKESFSDLPGIIIDITGDTIWNKVQGRPMIFYSTGHNKRRWSLIYKDSSSLEIVSGETTHNGISEHKTKDEMLLLLKNNNLITWGLDSCGIIMSQMKRIENKGYSPLYNQLFIFGNDNRSAFVLNNARSFSGKDSIQVNQKLDKLIYLMWWIALPELQEIIPFPSDSISFGKIFN